MVKRLPLALVMIAGTLTVAQASCPDRISVGSGQSLSTIARACGVNVEALKQVNPGLRSDGLRAGQFLVIPTRPVHIAPPTYGRPSIQQFPSLVGPALGGDTRSTVILPPQPQPVPQQHILRGFGDKPGQLPLPPGHSSPFP
jgi:LysM repeat protein